MQIKWVNQVDFCVWTKRPLILYAIDFPISVHNGRHFSADGFETVRPIAMKF